MAEKKDFNPEKDIEFSVVARLKKKIKPSQTDEHKTSPGASVEADYIDLEPEVKSNSNVISNETHYRRGLFFDYFSTAFHEILSTSKPPFSFIVVKDLSNLTQALKTSPQQVLFINWSINPKVYDQLLVQINAKFPSIHIVITGTDLNAQKAKEIKTKYSFVKSFLVLPATMDQLKKVLQIN
jgi:hypothetical protein